MKINSKVIFSIVVLSLPSIASATPSAKEMSLKSKVSKGKWATQKDRDFLLLVDQSIADAASYGSCEVFISTNGVSQSLVRTEENKLSILEYTVVEDINNTLERDIVSIGIKWCQ